MEGDFIIERINKIVEQKADNWEGVYVEICGGCEIITDKGTLKVSLDMKKRCCDDIYMGFNCETKKIRNLHCRAVEFSFPNLDKDERVAIVPAMDVKTKGSIPHFMITLHTDEQDIKFLVCNTNGNYNHLLNVELIKRLKVESD